MNREVHVRFCESVRVRSPCATRLTPLSAWLRFLRCIHLFVIRMVGVPRPSVVRGPFQMPVKAKACEQSCGLPESSRWPGPRACRDHWP